MFFLLFSILCLIKHINSATTDNNKWYCMNWLENCSTRYFLFDSSSGVGIFNFPINFINYFKFLIKAK